MPITLTSGPINSGKTTRMLKALSATKPGVTGMLIVPDAFTATELKRLFLSKSKDPALKGDAIMDWHGFVRSLADAKRPLLARGQVILAILDLLSKTQLSYFSRAQKSFGLATQLASAVLTLKANCIDPTRLQEMIKANKLPAKRELDLLKIFSAYEIKLKELKAVDEGDLTSLAIENILAERKELLPEDVTLLFDEFINFTSGQIALINTVQEVLPESDIQITFPTPETSSRQYDLYGNYIEQGYKVARKISVKELKLKACKPPRCKAQVSVSSSPAQEARAVARLLEQAKGQGICASEVIVASRAETTFMEWFLSEAHSLELLPGHPTLDGATASPFIHELLSRDSLDALPKRTSIEQYISCISKTADVRDQTDSWIAKLKERKGRGRVAARSLMAAAQLEEILKKLAVSANFLGIKKIGREDFLKSLFGALRARTSPHTQLDAVLPFRNAPLGTPLAAHAKEVIVPRAIEGNLPTINADAPFFADWEDEAIRGCFPSAEDIHAREAYAFETLHTKCTGKITFIMPAINDQGSETLRSPFIDRFLDDANKPHSIVPQPLSIKNIDADRMIEIEDERRYGIDPLKSKHPTYLGVLTSAKAKEIVRKRFTENEMSTTALERYANCPFSFFARHVLRINELKEDEPEVHPLDRGTIVHEILRRFYKEHADDVMAARFDDNAASRIDRTLNKLCSQVWEQSADIVERVSAGLREKQLTDIKTMTLQVIRSEIDEAKHIKVPLMPKECEWSFGRDFGTELSISVDGEKPLAIRGRVDRIDIAEDGKHFLVIDYKTGKAKSIINRVYDGRHLQLPLYISAVKAYLLPDAFALGGLIIEVKGTAPGQSTNKTAGKTQGIVRKEFEGKSFRVGKAKSKVDDSVFEEVLECATAYAAKYIKAIRRGEFSPKHDAVCDFCDNGDTCRYKKMAAD